MVNKENHYQEYKGHTKWLSLISSRFAFGAKCQRASVKALVQADFLTYALSKHKHNPYLIGKNG